MHQQLNLFDAPTVAASNGKAPAKLPAFSALNYTITQELGTGGVKTWFKRNVAAIKLLKQIEAEGRRATDEEKDILVEYVGWGGLPQVFDRRNTKWAGEFRILDELLTYDEYKAASRSILNAHYTSLDVIQSIWQGVQRLGFRRGTVLEPALGIGHFFGSMPEELRPKTTLYGVELDSISARIATHLYPSAQIENKSIHEYQPRSPFDLVISNVPFGDYKLPDFEFYRNGRGNLKGANIHDYYFLKALDLVRTGGLIAFITSRYTMDKADTTYRQYIASKARLLGAIRLPHDVFKANANTETTMDVLFLQKTNELPEEMPMWVETERFDDKNYVNRYFVENPEMMLGRMQVTHRKHQGAIECVGPAGWRETLPAVIDQLPADVYKNGTPTRQRVQARTLSMDSRRPYVQPPDKPWLRESSYDVDEWFRVFQKQNGRWLQLEWGKRTSQIRDLCEVRDAFRRVLQANVEYLSDEELAERQADLHQLYDRFVRKWGPINHPNQARLFSADPDYYPMRALEDYDEERNKAQKRPIFYRRTILPAAERQAETAQDAMLISLEQFGVLNVGHMAELLGEGYERDVTQELVEEDLIFADPEIEPARNGGHRWVTRDAYLSGNVRHKLAMATEAAQTDSAYERNVEALEAVQPADLAPEEIICTFGAHWVPAPYVNQFIDQVLWGGVSTGLKAGYDATLGKWLLDKSGCNVWRVDQSPENTSSWGTERAPAVKLIEKTLAGQIHVVRDTVEEPDGSERRVVNQAESLAAQQKQEAIKAAWRSWLWQDQARAEQLAGLYNQDFNNSVQRRYDGSLLRLEGMNAAVELYGHQKNGVWRAIQSDSTLLAHIVGSGKTFTLITIAMELRRLGLASKPVIVVKNATFARFVSDAFFLYPNANILPISSLPRKQRTYLTGRIALEEWDMVITTHETFAKLQLKPETIRYWYEQQIKELHERIAEIDDKRDITQKELEKRVARLESKIALLMDKSRHKDDGLYFEELGLDCLLADEVQVWKNLYFPTTMSRLPGIGGTESGRAYDAFMKIRWLKQARPEAKLIFATGTPVENSVCEMYTMMRYLIYEELEKLGLHHFDAWAKLFGDTVTAVEMTPDGGDFYLKTRFAKFNNVPELLQLFWSFADVQMDRQTLGLAVPALVSGKPIGVTAEPAPMVEEITQTLVHRAANLDPRDRQTDNMLKIVGEARKAAIDPRLLGPVRVIDEGGNPTGRIIRATEDHPGSKLNQAVDNLLNIYHEPPTKTARCQAIFLDLYRSDEFSVHDDIVAKLTAGGVQPEEIAIAQKMNGDEAKLEMQKKARQGRIRIVIGSTQTLGIGVNIQDRLYACHNLDVPWKPAEYEQRLGRIIRQGNLNQEVLVYNYLTARTFDVFMWETNQRKARFIAQVMTGDLTVRTMEDIDEAVVTYTEMAAMASGNPLIIEKVKVEADVTKYRSLAGQHRQSLWSVEQDRDHLAALLNKSQGVIARWQPILERVEAEGPQPLYALGQRLYETCLEVWAQHSVHQIGELYGRPVMFNNQAVAEPEPQPGQMEHVVDFFAKRDAARKGEAAPEPAKEEVKTLQRIEIDLPGRTHSFRLRVGKDHKETNAAELVKLIGQEAISARLSKLVEQSEEYQARIKQLEDVLTQPFEHAGRLRDLEERLAEIELQLSQAVNPKKGGESDA